MKTQLKVLAAMFGVLALVGLGFVFAGNEGDDVGRPGDCPGHRGHFGMHGEGGIFLKHLGFAGEHLDLTDEQKAEIRSIIEEEMPAIRERRQKMAEIRKEMHQTLPEGEFNEKLVRSYADKLAQEFAQSVVDKARIHAKIYSVFTPAQQEKLKELHENMPFGEGPFGMGYGKGWFGKEHGLRQP